MTAPDNDNLDGFNEHSGDDALRAAESAERAARAGGADPLAGLLDRVRVEGTAPALNPSVVAALAVMRREQPERFVAWLDAAREASKAGGRRFHWTELSKALAERDRSERDAAKRAARRELPDAAAREQAAALAAAAIARARAEVPDELAAHYAAHEAADDTGARSVMEPGRVAVERPGRGGRVEVKLLAAFSAVIRREVHDVDLPGAEPRRTFVLGAVFPGERFERLGEVRADEFSAMRWPEVVFGARAVVHDSGRRDDLRIAIQSMSAPVEVRRYRFTGWHEVDGRMVYLHRSGAVGEDGPVEGFAVDPAGAARRFDFGDLSIDPARGVAAVLELLSVEPATVAVTLAAASFRAAMGPSRLSVHVWGPTATGKSCVVGLAQAMFGASMHGDAMPASWADKSTENGIAALFARVGDAIVGTDDMVFRGSERDDVEKAKRVDGVIRAHYNRAAPIKLNRDGSQRPERPSRCVPVSTGEAKPRGHSTVNRMVCVEMPQRSPTDLARLKQLAADGVLARGMAAFAQWYAPRVKGNLPRLDALERAAALRWGLGGSDRAGALFGALALGFELMLAWLGEAGVDGALLHQHEQRARAALAEVAHEHGEDVEDANPARRFVPLLLEAIRAGDAHIKVAARGGRGVPPPSPESWGWRTDGHDGPKHLGKCVAWVKDNEVLVDRGVALGVVRERAQRAGDPFPLDAKALARDLDAAGLLARTDMHVEKRPTHTVRGRVGGAQPDLLAFALEVFGVDLAAADDGEGHETDAP